MHCIEKDSGRFFYLLLLPGVVGDCRSSLTSFRGFVPLAGLWPFFLLGYPALSVVVCSCLDCSSGGVAPVLVECLFLL